MKVIILILSLVVAFETGILWLTVDIHKYDSEVFNQLWKDCTRK